MEEEERTNAFVGGFFTLCIYIYMAYIYIHVRKLRVDGLRMCHNRSKMYPMHADNFCQVY